ncbi:type 1 fimbrial protein [Haemophilus influenzae]|uniref:fimbrial protein n=1 Tax=Haemophilus influenzae TaxID=727 RepID=UPI0013AF7B6E|nr:fimbrial protein [Haemophilus influenzae]MCK9139685.1 type 1 fimbrial protein [Haemophilus influenzae]NXZ85290.1 type 1 fimbrial protein [Haemophilus influenzae]
MKKLKFQYLFLLTSIFVSFASAYDGEIRFKAEITKAGTCEVSTDSVNKTVNLNITLVQNLINQGSTANETPFKLNVEKCGDVTDSNHIKFALSRISTSDDLPTGVLPNKNTTAINRNTVGVQLISNSGTPIEIGFSPSGSPTIAQSRSTSGNDLGAVLKPPYGFEIPLKARFYSLTNGSANKEGQVEAEVTFAVFYE